MSAVDGSVHIPGLGTRPKKQVILIGGGVIVVVGVAVYRARSAAAAAATTTTDTTGTDASTLDPATGYAYGSAEDTAALEAQGAYQTPNTYGAGSTSADPGNFPTTGITTNAEWVDAVITEITSEDGSAGSSWRAALGKYVTGEDLTASEASLVTQAIAIEGYPPVAGSTGYPPHVRQTTTARTPTKTLTAPRLSFTIVDSQRARLSWTQGPNVKAIRVNRDGAQPVTLQGARSYVVPRGNTYSVTAQNAGVYNDSPNSNSVIIPAGNPSVAPKAATPLKSNSKAVLTPHYHI